MINQKINKLREKLNKSITDQKDYKEIYKISVELDQLIAKFYKKGKQSKKEMVSKK